MPCKIKNDYGTISINNEVIARIAGMTAMECYGVVGMAGKSVRDGLVHLLQIENLTRGIRLAAADDAASVSIDLHIIAEYGTNITAISDSIMSTVKYRVEEATGLIVSAVNVFVEGLRVNS